MVTTCSEPCWGWLLGPLFPPLLGAGLAESNENSPLRPRATTGLLWALCPGSPQKGSALALPQLRNTCLPVLRKSTAAPSFPLLCLPRHWLGPHSGLTCCPWEQRSFPQPPPGRTPLRAADTAGSRPWHSPRRFLRVCTLHVTCPHDSPVEPSSLSQSRPSPPCSVRLSSQPLLDLRGLGCNWREEVRWAVAAGRAQPAASEASGSPPPLSSLHLQPGGRTGSHHLRCREHRLTLIPGATWSQKPGIPVSILQ